MPISEGWRLFTCLYLEAHCYAHAPAYTEADDPPGGSEALHGLHEGHRYRQETHQ